MKILSIGATGSIGRHVIAHALDSGHEMRALVRDPGSASLPGSVELVTGDVTDPGSLAGAVDGVDAVVFTHGAHTGKAAIEAVDYGGVRNILSALGEQRVRIALMTAIGVTVHDGPHNRSTGAHDWKRRSERLVRASGHQYTIVRPGWFDYNDAGQLHLQFLQGDTRRAGNYSDGVISRAQIAQVLLASLTSPTAVGKTFELVAEQGPAQEDLEPLFAALDPDRAGGIDGGKDPDTLPLAEEPAPLRADLDALRRA